MEDADQNKGIAQLLLSPVFLLHEILGTLIPGAVLLLLLVHKGSPVLRDHPWVSPLFGYKTNIAVFLLFAYVVGKALVLPILFIMACAAASRWISAEVHKGRVKTPATPADT